MQVRAAAAGHYECVAVLRHRSPEQAMQLLDACYGEGELQGHNALSIAALNGHSSVVRELLEEDPIADVHSGPYHGASLLEAARRGHGQVVDALLQHGCDPDCHKATDRTSAICEAAGRLCWPVCAVCSSAPFGLCFTNRKVHCGSDAYRDCRPQNICNLQNCTTAPSQSICNWKALSYNMSSLCT